MPVRQTKRRRSGKKAAARALYGADYVPVGADQKQHLEIARDLAIRFNSRYSDTFVVPEPYIAKVGAKVMSLQDPTKKMSKSDENVNAFVSMDDSPEDVVRKFKRAVTDSDNKIIFDEENKPGISNLLTIYSAFSGESIAEAEKRFEGKGYGDFKLAVGETVAEALAPVRAKYESYMADRAELERIMKAGAEKAARIASRTLQKVKKKIGFVAD